jgi:cell wall-associated NlpC family hydrolase
VSLGAAGIPLSIDDVVAHYLSERTVAEASRTRREYVGKSLTTQLDSAKAAATHATYDGAAAVTLAASFKGVPYRMGGASPRAFDCSGYTMYVFGKLGYDLPHFAQSQYQWATPVSQSQAQVGDLVFFHQSGGYVYHVGIYAGNGQVWHAPKPGRSVELSQLFGSVTFGTVPQEILAADALRQVHVLETAVAVERRGLPT